MSTINYYSFSYAEPREKIESIIHSYLHAMGFEKMGKERYVLLEEGSIICKVTDKEIFVRLHPYGNQCVAFQNKVQPFIQKLDELSRKDGQNR